MEVLKNQKPTIPEATLFFSDLIKKSQKNIKPLKTNKEKTAIVVDKSDKDLYDWAKNG